MEVIKTDCGLCINCCGVNAYVEDGKLVKVEGMPEHWLNKGQVMPERRAARGPALFACPLEIPHEKGQRAFSENILGRCPGRDRSQITGVEGQVRRPHPGDLDRFGGRRAF